MGDVHAEIAHDTDLAARLGAPLPVARLCSVDIGGMRELRSDVDDVAEGPGCRIREGPHGPGEEGHLARDPDEGIGRLDGGNDALGCCEIDAERLLAEEIPPGRGRGDVELLVQVMRNGEVEHVDRIIVDKLAPIFSEGRDRGNRAKPVAGCRIRIGNCHDLGLDRVMREVQPTAAQRRKFAAHETAAHDADANWARRHQDAANSASAPVASTPSWSIAMSARVMPAGFGCWMMLRP